MTMEPSALHRWGIFAIVSAIFFHVTGSTFTSLGVVLPYMIEDLSWSWTNAGLGFTLLALTTGLASTLPAWTLRNLGIKATYGFGCAVMALGFSVLALTTGLLQYFIGTSLLGVGFALCSTVPAMHVLSEWMPDKRSMVIGAFMTIGALGGVAGPLVVTGIVGATGSWHMHWWVMAASILFLGVLAILFVRDPPTTPADAKDKEQPADNAAPAKVFLTQRNWRFRSAIRTRQYFIIVTALTTILFCSVTMNTWAVTHLGTLGISAAVAAGALSMLSLVNAFSRAAGGLIATRIDPKWLVVSALAAELISMLSLSVADNMVIITIFAIAEGYAFGMCYFATIMLLINYFGPRDNPEILGTLNLVSTLAMLGPVLGGYVGDTVGSFSIVFQSYAVLVLVVLVLTASMKPPAPKESELHSD